MMNLTQATEALAKGTADKPRVLVRYMFGFAIKRLVVTAESRFAQCDPVTIPAGRALAKRGVPVHDESVWVWGNAK